MVSGLIAKRKELCELRQRFREKIKKLSEDIGHLDACIKLFDLEDEAQSLKEYVAKPRSKKGSIKRFVLSTLREADKPMTSLEISERLVLDPDMKVDEKEPVKVRRQVGDCIKTSVNQGLIECAGTAAASSVNGPYKLWRLKRGG